MNRDFFSGTPFSTEGGISPTHLSDPEDIDLVQLDPFPPSALLDFSHPGRADPEDKIETTNLHSDQDVSLVTSTPNLQQHLWATLGRINRQDGCDLMSEHAPDSSVPVVVRDRFRSAEGLNFESFANTAAIVQGAPSTLNEGTGIGQPGLSEWSASVLSRDRLTDCNRKDQTCLPSSNNGVTVDSNSFRAMTVDDEDERQRILGTSLDQAFPEVPDIFLKAQNHIGELDEPSNAEKNNDIPENSETDHMSVEHRSIGERNSTPNFRITVQNEDMQSTTERNVDDMDVVKSRSSSPNIVEMLGYMPAGAFSAFLDGNEPIGDYAPDALRSHADDDSNLYEMLERETSLEELGPLDDEGAYLLDELLKDGDADDMDIETDMFANREALRDVTNHPVDNEEPENIPNVEALRAIANHSINSQEPQTASNTGRIDMPSIYMKDLLKRVKAFDKKMRKQLQPGDRNLKYYSLKRMDKDVKENMELSRELFFTAVRLRQQKKKLDEECKKERQEIRRMREILGL